MLALLAQSLALLAFVWAFKRWMSKTDLDNIPGPEPESFFKGNLAQMFDASSAGWEFTSMISERCMRFLKVILSSSDAERTQMAELFAFGVCLV
ncbi:hypothetical protein C0995_005666 [Termitomyces sp. Mi166|nr:hypothetical protein C0995_005666 [Termitomyces sp. Mi166\